MSVPPASEPPIDPAFADAPSPPLLGQDEPAPVILENIASASPWLIVCDHAGRRIPRSLENLGVEASELERHIAWDIGALALARELSQELACALVAQRYSRLVIDCNRPLAAADSIATLSEHTRIPGNERLTPAQAAQRAQAIFAPYHAAIAELLDLRAARGQASIMIAVHSFTPSYKGDARRWHAGVLYQRDARFAKALLVALRTDTGLIIGDNEPYSVSDETDYTIPVHAERRGIPHVELEIRQDLIADAAGQREWAERLAPALRSSLALINE